MKCRQGVSIGVNYPREELAYKGSITNWAAPSILFRQDIVLNEEELKFKIFVGLS